MVRRCIIPYLELSQVQHEASLDPSLEHWYEERYCAVLLSGEKTSGINSLTKKEKHTLLPNFADLLK